uniref:IRG-type G domain-containing protein n=1 Tax=Amphilophus citrinellus TaxID=61819 RepID=A0A3Q0RTY3_AMPCI
CRGRSLCVKTFSSVVNITSLFPTNRDPFASLKNALKNNDTAAAVAKIEKYIEKHQNSPLNVAITGECGVGKSTFVNAFRGNKDEDEGGDVVETISKVTSYPHPIYPNVTLWDLPGIGSTVYPANEYLKRVEFEKFDFFIIISATRFKENDVKLAKKIQKMKKKFYFVRSKIDNDIRAAERMKGFNEEESLKGQGIKSPQVFLVSSFHLDLYDFPLLRSTFRTELPKLRRRVLLLLLPNINMEIIDKKEAFLTKIKYCTLLSAAVAAVPLPGLSAAVDIGLMVTAVRGFVVGFGLDKPSLMKRAASSGVPYTDLCAGIKSPWAGVEIDRNLIIKIRLIRFTPTAALLAVKECTRSISEFGTIALISAVKNHLQNNDPAAAVARIQEHSNQQHNTPLNIAITGESGSGKSTFVNAFRGISDEDDGAAPTGVVESSKDPKAYFHPDYPNVILWDLPGIGTMKFPADEYLKHIEFEKFDFFIIISDTRFTENDLKLVQEIQKKKKKFYFVRSKIDNDLNTERRKFRYSEERTLRKIRDEILYLSKIFAFIVRSIVALYLLLFVMSHINLEILRKKKEAFQSKTKYYASLSAGVAAVPLPGVSTAVDVGLMAIAAREYVHGFGLDKSSLQRLSASSGVPYPALLAVTTSRLVAGEITNECILNMLPQLASGLSFTVTYTVLNYFIDTVADDGQRVFKRSLKGPLYCETWPPSLLHPHTEHWLPTGLC